MTNSSKGSKHKGFSLVLSAHQPGLCSHRASSGPQAGGGPWRTCRSRGRKEKGNGRRPPACSPFVSQRVIWQGLVPVEWRVSFPCRDVRSVIENKTIRSTADTHAVSGAGRLSWKLAASQGLKGVAVVSVFSRSVRVSSSGHVRSHWPPEHGLASLVLCPVCSPLMSLPTSPPLTH